MKLEFVIYGNNLEKRSKWMIDEIRFILRVLHPLK